MVFGHGRGLLVSKQHHQTKTACRHVPLGPKAQQASATLQNSFPLALLHPAVSKSGDQLRLPGLAGHLGAALCDNRRACWGLTVQTQTADQVLQCRSSGLPSLLDRNIINLPSYNVQLKLVRQSRNNTEPNAIA